MAERDARAEWVYRVLGIDTVRASADGAPLIDPSIAFQTRLKALFPKIREAVTAGGESGQAVAAGARQARDAAGQADFVAANSALDDVEYWLEHGASLVGSPTTVLWQQARDAVDSQLNQLYGVLKMTGEPVLAEVADEIENVLAAYRTRLTKSLMEYDAAAGPARQTARQTALGVVTEHLTMLPADRHVIAADTNPFGVSVSIRATLGTALGALRAKLQLQTS